MWLRLCLRGLNLRLFLTSSIMSGDGITLLSFNSATIGKQGGLCRLASARVPSRSNAIIKVGFDHHTYLSTSVSR